MNRSEVIQRIIDQRRAKNYLEIGVNNGVNFFKIRAPRKIGVDPKFCYTPRRKISWFLRNRTNWRAQFLEMTSDQYFSTAGERQPVDVAFIDGLHTHEQSLQDVLNTLNRLTDDGVIVMHDCNPPSEGAATPASSLETAQKLDVPGVRDAWCGDVWKTVCYLRSQRSDLRVFVLDTDHGLGIVTKGKPEGMLSLDPEKLRKMTYRDLAQDKEGLLNLKNENYLDEFLADRDSVDSRSV